MISFNDVVEIYGLNEEIFEDFLVEFNPDNDDAEAWLKNRGVENIDIYIQGYKEYVGDSPF
jgi:hypothetical protein